MLDRSPEEMKLQMLMASRWAKVNAIFLSKKPAEVCLFRQSSISI
jgi:serine/threonine-protein phosphatase 6 regulatory subunit 3